MPILDVEIVLRSDEILESELAQKIADEAGKIFGTSPGGTWVKMQFLPDQSYAENGGAKEVHPIFVSILKSKLPSAAEMQKEVDLLTQAIARICNRPSENVHIIYSPEATGRVAFGGKIVGI